MSAIAGGIGTSRKFAREMFLAHSPANQGVTLKAAAAEKGLLYGAATSRKILQSDPDFERAFVQQCGVITPEGEMKWKALRPGGDKFRFDDADWLVDWAHKNGILFRGHTLVWHLNLPDWIQKEVNRSNAEKVMVDHIRNVVSHFQGKIHSWDVVNEIIQPKDGGPDGLAKGVWLDNIGPDYVAKAFRAAKAADPQPLLVWNERMLEYDLPYSEDQRSSTLKVLRKLKSSGAPIDALGIQSHLRDELDPKFNARKFQDFLHQVADLGLKILITELDVREPKTSMATRDNDLSRIYQKYLNAVLAEKAVISVQTWGLSDKYTWLSKDSPRPDNQPVAPLPLDASYGGKPIFDALINAFQHAPSR
jgi:endo-1,4-beta-xylanase